MSTQISDRNTVTTSEKKQQEGEPLKSPLQFSTFKRSAIAVLFMLLSRSR